MDHKFRIDSEIKALLSPLTDGEYRLLEASILENGCQDPLKVWNGILLDGHNRLRICKKHGIEYEVVKMEFEDRSSAKIWVIRNQAGRRNLTTWQKAALAVRLQKELASMSKKLQVEAGKRYGEGHPKGEEVSPTSEKPLDTWGTAAKTFETSKDSMMKYIRIEEKGSPEQKEKASSGEMSPNEVYKQIQRREKEEQREERRNENRKLIAKTPSIETLIEQKQAKFATILMDPPWDWGDEGDIDQFGRARPTYNTMSYEELLALPVGDLADVDCHLYLWITNRSLPKGFGLIKHWGFRYITCVTWCKPSIGMGNYFRGQTEHLLFGVKGSQPLKRRDVGTWFQAQRGKEHSSKPLEIYDIIESCSPGPYLEMFARHQRSGWVPWGEELGSE